MFCSAIEMVVSEIRVIYKHPIHSAIVLLHFNEYKYHEVMYSQRSDLLNEEFLVDKSVVFPFLCKLLICIIIWSSSRIDKRHI